MIRHHFASWLAGGAVLRGWACSVSGDLAKGVAWIEEGMRDYVASGATLHMPYLLAVKAETLHLADRTPEALAVKPHLIRYFEESLQLSLSYPFYIG